MTFGPIALAELPNIDNVTIEYQVLHFYTFEVTKQFLGMASIGTQVNIRNDEQIYFAFWSFHSGVRLRLRRCKRQYPVIWEGAMGRYRTFAFRKKECALGAVLNEPKFMFRVLAKLGRPNDMCVKEALQKS
jgi:hypothetical protein